MFLRFCQYHTGSPAEKSHLRRPRCRQAAASRPCDPWSPRRKCGRGRWRWCECSRGHSSRSPRSCGSRTSYRYPRRRCRWSSARETTLRPSSRRRFAVFCVPLPPRMTRQSSFIFFVVILHVLDFIDAVFIDDAHELERLAGGTQNGTAERVKMPEKSSGFISLYSPKIRPL